MTTRLLLVDGSSYLYRAYHALPDLRTSRGEPTGAIRGVLSMLRRLAQEFPSPYRACVFDAPGKTFRDEWYPQYKAQRPEMPEDLAAQIPVLHEAIEAEGWPLLMIPGVEADDVIGTLTRQALARGWEVVISTGDKDLTQLVGPRVLWVDTMRGEKLDAKGVEEKFGVPPERIVDYLALVGDTVDNVPGVAGCGPKTAAKWLQQYGSLEALLAHADEIKGKVGENLRAARDFLPLARKLLTVRCDLDLPVRLDDLQARPPQREKLLALYERLEFQAWLNELRAQGVAAPAGQEGGDGFETPAQAAARRSAYACITDWDEFERWLGEIEQGARVAFDTETTSLDARNASLVGVSFAVGPGRACYIPLAHRGLEVGPQLPREEVLRRLAPWFATADGKVAQNAKYDWHVLAAHGAEPGGTIDDTMLMSYVLESDAQHDLDRLSRRWLSLEPLTYAELCGSGKKQIGFDEVPPARAAAYAAEDADLTWRLFEVLSAKLAAEPRLERVYRDIERPLVPVLVAMERAGVAIDPKVLAAQSREFETQLRVLEQKAHELAGRAFNLASPKQVAELLFGELGLKAAKKTAENQASTSEEVLERLAHEHPIVEVLLQHRQLSKLKNTYLDKLPKMIDPRTGRVHTTFSQSVVVTGRLSSSEPNLQNIPARTPEGRRIRSAFVAPTGCLLLSADYSQIELRIMAHLSGDATLVAAFLHGEDIHRHTAAEIFGVPLEAVTPEQRRVAKTINFGLIYGMSAHGLARSLGIDRASAQEYIDRYFARYPGVAKYMEQARKTAYEQGYVETLYGRRVWLRHIRSRNPAQRQADERAAINAPMQGTAADLIKLAMIGVHRALQEGGLATRLVLQVHDELVLEVPEAEVDAARALVTDQMQNVAKLRVPLVVDVGVGRNWDEAH